MVEANNDYDDGQLYGEDLANYIAEMRAKAEAFFAQAGKDPLEIYRIEKFEPVRQAPETHGKFYQGDSYVVLSQKRGNYDIHYWHGKEATADEMGSSAALSTQLSGNLPMQSRHHLEEQEMETDMFMTYFKSGLFYLEGGIESGFKKVNAEVHEPKLMHIKGKRYPRVHSVPVAASSLNEGDCFVLDLGEQLFVWNGSQANMFEKQKAGEIAVAIKQDDRMGHARVDFVQSMQDADQAPFWDALGGRPDSIAPPLPDDVPAGTEDERMQYKLFHISDDSGSIVTTEVTARPLKKEMLSTNDSYILELYDAVYVWQGKKSSAKEKYAGMKIGKDFIKNNNKPKGTKLSRIPEGTEDSTFKSFFNDFYPCVAQDFANDPVSAKTSANQSLEAMAGQVAKAKKVMFDKLGDLSKVEKKVYFVESDWYTLTEITDPREHGKFFAESCYVIQLKSPTTQFLITWVGPGGLDDELAKISEATVALTGGVLSTLETRTRVKKGHEDEGLLSFFPEGFTILDEARMSMDDWYAKIEANGAMFRVQAPFGEGARAIEQNECSSKYLNSGDAFCVIKGDAGFVWSGMGADDVEKAAAEKLFDSVKRPAATSSMKEGEESAEFWDSIGGQAEYSHIKQAVGMVPADFDPRLFAVSNRTGYMWMDEIPAFGQEDLINDDCYILDAYNTIYVWIGHLSNKFERNGVQKKAKQYLAELKDRDTSEVMVEQVSAGYEPPAFQVQFIQWEPEVAEQWIKDDPTVIAAKVEEETKAAAEGALAATADPFAGKLDPKTNKMTYEVLKSSFPDNIPVTKKEYYMTDEEFVQVLGMTVEEWDTQKQWKKDRKKKEVGLF